MVTETYTVRGMACGNCAVAVTELVTKFSGVTEVNVDVSKGLVDVSSAEQLDQARVAAAVDEAGYELVTP